jgi:hypothetical protein
MATFKYDVTIEADNESDAFSALLHAPGFIDAGLIDRSDSWETNPAEGLHETFQDIVDNL